MYHIGIADQMSVTEPYLVQGSAYVSGIDPTKMQVKTVVVVYSTDNWQSSQEATGSYDIDNSRMSASIPPQPAGSIVRYYFKVFDNFGSSAKLPLNAPKSCYLFLVGYDSKFFYDCESPDGWKRLGGEAATGEWVRAVPVGSWNVSLGTPPDVPYVQPNEDHTPGLNEEKCWVTGNAAVGDDLGENDVDDGATLLATREYDVSTMTDPILRYYRWYTNDQGASPGGDTWLVEISSDGGDTWITLENTKESMLAWQPIIIRLRDYVQLTSQLKVQFTASDEDPQSLVEAAVDDFEILDINKSLAVEQLNATPGGFDLSQNFPNPFNPSTAIRYSIPEGSFVTLRVYSAAGQPVSTIVSQYQTAGSYQVTFDAHSLSSGVYKYELTAGGKRSVRSMTVIK
jgi:hypothetical protein